MGSLWVARPSHGQLDRVSVWFADSALDGRLRYGRGSNQLPGFDLAPERLWSGGVRNQTSSSSGQEHLSSAPGQVFHQVRIPFRIQLARDVIQEQQRQKPDRLVQILDLGDLPSQHQSALLSLGSEAFGGVVS